MTDRASQRQAALDALMSGWQSEGGGRTDHLLTALTHAVLALGETPTAAALTAPASDAPRAMQLLSLIRSVGGDWDSKRALAAYKALGIKADGSRVLDAKTARQDLIALADARLIERVDGSSTFTALKD
ncbi:hypothetical protein [Streptomyces sp. H51]|uniref:hypothetical protein n=1 Tax=Streptomyces sp. H51 TaxID=3111770 RepID=UPI002D77CF8C|nr:hypothetical protein [Streptomyces sp. H51]